MRYKEINNIVSIESFDSVREFTKVCATRKVNSAFELRELAGDLASECTRKRKWYGSHSFDAANKIMQKGYKEGCKDLLTCKEGIKVMNDAPKSKTIKNYAGFCPCVPAAIMGMPKTMYYKKKMQVKTPVINLYYDCGVNCSVDPETMLLGGKNVYSLCKYLDSRNIRVNLFIFHGCYIGGLGKHAFLTIKVKNADQPVNPQLIAYPIMHPSFFRRHIFKWIETSKGTDYSSLTNGYGYISREFVCNFQKLLLDSKILDENSYYISIENSANCGTLEDMLLRIGLKL